MHRSSILGALLIASSHATAYDILHDHSGSTFFDGWDFYGSWDNLTLGASLVLCVVYLRPSSYIIKGNVTWVTQEVASSQNLAYVNSENHVILKVDNITNVPFGQMRNSVWTASSLLAMEGVDKVVLGPHNDPRRVRPGYFVDDRPEPHTVRVLRKFPMLCFIPKQ
ncbi:hypothetical protein J3R82DRAFT_6758 [Butyriboletus roseoflavus]|nr:hypothetical protein J3R82DRAFT_6758 [Butyriboletus roseoflavus]